MAYLISTLAAAIMVSSFAVLSPASAAGTGQCDQVLEDAKAQDPGEKRSCRLYTDVYMKCHLNATSSRTIARLMIEDLETASLSLQTQHTVSRAVISLLHRPCTDTDSSLRLEASLLIARLQQVIPKGTGDQGGVTVLQATALLGHAQGVDGERDECWSLINPLLAQAAKLNNLFDTDNGRWEVVKKVVASIPEDLCDDLIDTERDCPATPSNNNNKRFQAILCARCQPTTPLPSTTPSLPTNSDGAGGGTVGVEGGGVEGAVPPTNTTHYWDLLCDFTQWLYARVCDLFNVITSPITPKQPQQKHHFIWGKTIPRKSKIRSVTTVLKKFIEGNPTQIRVHATAKHAMSKTYTADAKMKNDPNVDYEVAEVTRVVARSVKSTCHFYPYATQIIAVIQHLMKSESGSSVATEVATGHGKSIIIAMIVAGASKLQPRRFPERFHVLTTTDYLASRDALDFAAFYKPFGIKACGIQSDGECTGADVVYGTFLRLNSAHLATVCHDSPSLFEADAKLNYSHHLIADESDAFYIDNAANGLATKKSDGTPGVRRYRSIMIAMNIIMDVFVPEINPNGTVTIRNPPNGGELAAAFATARNWSNASSVDPEYRMESITFLNVTEFDTFLCSALRNATNEQHSEEFGKLLWSFPAALRMDARSEFGAWCASLRTSRGLRDEYHYKIQGGNTKVVPYDSSIGTLMDGTVWKNGLDDFLRIQKNLPFLGPTPSQCSRSIFGFLDSYASLSALSGTIGSHVECDMLKEVYDMECVRVPSRFKRNVRMMEPNITRDRVGAVLHSAAQVIQDQPVLVVVEYMPTVEKIFKAIGRHPAFANCTVINASEAKNLPTEPLNVNTVIVATRAASRGVDLKLGGVAAIYGLHVVIGDISHYRNNNQTLGRGCRGADTCSIQFIIKCNSNETCAMSFDDYVDREQEAALALIKAVGGHRAKYLLEDNISYSIIMESKRPDSRGNHPSHHLQHLRRDLAHRAHDANDTTSTLPANVYLYERDAIYDALNFGAWDGLKNIPPQYENDKVFMVGTALARCSHEEFEQCYVMRDLLQQALHQIEKEHTYFNSTMSGSLLRQTHAEVAVYNRILRWVDYKILREIERYKSGEYKLTVSHQEEGTVYRLAGKSYHEQLFAKQLDGENLSAFPKYILNKKRDTWLTAFLVLAIGVLLIAVGTYITPWCPFIGKALVKTGLSTLLNLANLGFLADVLDLVLLLPLLATEGFLMKALGTILMPRFTLTIGGGGGPVERAPMRVLAESIPSWLAGQAGVTILSPSMQGLFNNIDEKMVAGAVKGGIDSSLSDLVGLFLHAKASPIPMLQAISESIQREMMSIAPLDLVSTIPIAGAVYSGTKAALQANAVMGDVSIKVAQAVRDVADRYDIDISAYLAENHLKVSPADFITFLCNPTVNYDKFTEQPTVDAKREVQEKRAAFQLHFKQLTDAESTIQQDLSSNIYNHIKQVFTQDTAMTMNSVYDWVTGASARREEAKRKELKQQSLEAQKKALFNTPLREVNHIAGGQ